MASVDSPSSADEMASPAPEFAGQSVEERPTLTDFMRARTAFITGPIVIQLERFGIKPDMLTVAGTLAHFFFAWLIVGGHLRYAAVAIFLLGPMDALDGALARHLSHIKRPFGAFLDSTLDRLAEIILFSGFLLYYLRLGDDRLVFIAYLAITGSLMVSYARARAEALNFNCKVGLFGRLERYGVLTLCLFLNLPSVALVVLAIFTYITVLQRLHYVWRQAYHA